MTTPTPSRPTRVLVVDDQPLLRHSLRLILEATPDLTVIGCAGTGTDAVRLTSGSMVGS